MLARIRHLVGGKAAAAPRRIATRQPGSMQ